MLIVRAEALFAEKQIMYEAYSKKFKPLEQGVMIPLYTLTFDLETQQLKVEKATQE